MNKNIIILIIVFFLGITACKKKDTVVMDSIHPVVRTDNSGNLLNPADSSYIRMIPLPGLNTLTSSEWVRQLGFVPKVGTDSNIDLYFFPNPSPALGRPILKVHSNNKPINYIFISGSGGSFERLDGGTSLDSASFITSTDVNFRMPSNGPEISTDYGFLAVTTDSCIYSSFLRLERF